MLASTSFTIATSGCLAIDPVELPEQPDFPPSVVDAPGTPYPSTGIIIEDFAADPDANLTLDVIVRDPNVAQTLQWAVFVDGTENDARRRRAEEIPTTGELTREVTVEVPGQFLADPGCHRVELVVTGAFDPLADRKPLRAHDFDSIVWWVAPSDSVALANCAPFLTPIFVEPEAAE